MNEKKLRALSFINEPDPTNIREDIELDPEFFLKEKLSNRFAFGVDNITNRGEYKEMGYIYNLRPFLRKYVCKSVYGDWHECYAINKANIRKLHGSAILKIIELEND